jgi:hypothetical protein
MCALGTGNHSIGQELQNRHRECSEHIRKTKDNPRLITYPSVYLARKKISKAILIQIAGQANPRVLPNLVTHRKVLPKLGH